MLEQMDDTDLSRRIIEARAELEREISFWHDLRLRRGCFCIDETFMERNPELVMRLMSKVIIFRAEMMYANRSIEYDALSRDFDVCESGTVHPKYRVMINDDSDIWFEKIPNA